MKSRLVIIVLVGMFLVWFLWLRNQPFYGGLLYHASNIFYSLKNLAASFR